MVRKWSDRRYERINILSMHLKFWNHLCPTLEERKIIFENIFPCEPLVLD